jgi:Na+-driven multidrug efflux pump
LSALLCLIYLRWAEPELLFRRQDRRMDRALLNQTVRYSLVTALHQTGLYIGKLLVQGTVNAAGLSVISAYTATTRIEGFANSFGDSGGAAASVMVAQNLGAGKGERVRKCFSGSLFLLLALGAVCSLIMYATSGLTVGLMLGSETGDAYENARLYLQTISIFYVFCFTGNAFVGYFDGCGKIAIPMVGAIGHITIRVILSWLLLPKLGLNAVALATGIGWVLANLFWGLLYTRQPGAKAGITAGLAVVGHHAGHGGLVSHNNK